MTNPLIPQYKIKKCKLIIIGMFHVQPVCMGCMQLIAIDVEYKIGDNGLVFHNTPPCELIATKRHIAYEQDYASSDNDIEPSTTIS
jgi:hypothetical protein